MRNLCFNDYRYSIKSILIYVISYAYFRFRNMRLKISMILQIFHK